MIHMSLDYDILFYSDKGIRKSVNQDSVCVMVADTSSGVVCMAIICDGMGGIKHGEYASGYVVEKFKKWFEQDLQERIEQKRTLEFIKNEWEKILIDADVYFREYGAQNQLKMGTTATCMLFMKDKYLLVQSGDSRAYEIKRKLKQLSVDQSYVQQQIDMGKLTPQEAKKHPKRNVLLNCIGGSRPSIPVSTFGTIRKNANYMLCSDGLVHELEEEEILYFLKPRKNVYVNEIQNNLKQMTELVMFRGETDNITVVLIETKGIKGPIEKGPYFHIRQNIVFGEQHLLKEEQTPTTEEE